MTEQATSPAAGAARTGNYFRETRPAEPDEPRVLYRVEEHIAHVVINRPLVLNAIHADVHRGIVDGMRRADADDEVRAVVLSGKGRAFSVGGDRGLSPEERGAEGPRRLDRHRPVDLELPQAGDRRRPGLRPRAGRRDRGYLRHHH